MTWVKVLGTFLIIALILPSSPVYARENKSVLILYESKTRLGEDIQVLPLLERYLKHFDISVNSCFIEDFVPNTHYDYIIYLGFQERNLNKELLKTLSSVKNLIWVEANIKQYADYLGWENFRDFYYKTGWISLIYRGEEYHFDIKSPVYIAYPQERQDMSFLYDYKEKTPWLWRRGNIWYFGRLDFRDNSFLVFFDLLHDILGEKHKEDKRVLMVLDEINPLTSPDKLRELMSSYCCEEVPVALVIYPYVRSSRSYTFLRENRELLELLKEIEKSNYAIIQGSYDRDLTLEKLDNDLTELARLGIFPIAFRLSSDAHDRYEVASRYFRIILANELIKMKDSKSIIYPISIEEYSLVNPKDYTYLLQRARDLKILRDAILGISVPAYISSEALRKLVKDLYSLGYSFLNLADEPFYVEGSMIRIENSNGRKVVISNIPPSEKTFLERLFDILIGYLRPILITVVILFVLIIFLLVRNKHRLYEVR